MNRPVLCALLAGMGACGDDPVSHSEPVGIHLAVSDGDVDGTTASDDKNINTESGNPYGAFVAAAREHVGGDPSSISVDAVTLRIAEGSGIATLGAVFDGAVTISFEMNGTSTLHPVASRDFAAADAAGPIALAVTFDSDSLPGPDYADLASGSFKVALTGEVADGFVALRDTADLEAVFLFTAYE
jgi:hypothetical protein